MSSNPKFFSLSLSKIDKALKNSDCNINYRRYFILFVCMPTIMAMLPFSSGAHYLTSFFWVDGLIYLVIMIFGLLYMFSLNGSDQLVTVKYLVCNYPIIYFICYIIIKPLPIIYIISLYFINYSVKGYEKYLVKAYVDSNFLNYTEIATNIILHIFIFFVLYRRYHNFISDSES